MSEPDTAARPPKLLSLVPSLTVGTTLHPAPLPVSVVVDTGSVGVGVGVGRSGTGTGRAAVAAEPVTANSGPIVLVCGSQECARQPRPKLVWIVLSSE